MAKHQVAVVQAGSRLFDTPATLDEMGRHCREASRTGARLMVFPEAYIGGYPKGLDFGARVGSRTADGRNDFVRYQRSAIEVPGAEVGQIAKFAKTAHAWVVVGVIERERSTLYCSALFFDPDGNGVHGLNERVRVNSVYKSRDYMFEVVKIYANQE